MEPKEKRMNEAGAADALAKRAARVDGPAGLERQQGEVEEPGMFATRSGHGEAGTTRDHRTGTLEELEALEAKARRVYGPARLSRGTRLALWLLRIYVVAMAAFVVIAFARQLR